MINSTRRRIVAASAIGVGASIFRQARAAIPTARIIVGFPVGGTADLIARLLASELQGRYADSVIVLNKPGAKFVPSMQELVSAPADGSVIYFSPDSIQNLMPLLYRKLPFSPMRDLAPVAPVAVHDYALAVGKSVPVDTFEDFTKWCRADSKSALVATLGIGSSPYFVASEVAYSANLEFTMVPYPGAAPSVNALVGGQVPAWVGPTPDVAPRYHDGAVKVIATSGAQRSSFFSNVPTFAELGYSEIKDISVLGAFLHSAVPEQTVRTLSNLIGKIVQQDGFKQSLQRIYYSPLLGDPAEFAAMIARTSDRFEQIIKKTGFVAED